MPRKIRLTPLQRDILWMLEEAGEAEMLTIRVTLQPADPEALGTAIAALTVLGYVQLSEVRGQESVVLTKEGRRALTV